MNSSPVGKKTSSVVLLIGVVIFWVTQLILVVDFKLLRGFGLFIYFADGRLIFTFVFVVTIIIIVLGTRGWRWDDAFGYHMAHKISSMYEILSRWSSVGAWALAICQTLSQSVGSYSFANGLRSTNKIIVYRAAATVQFEVQRARFLACLSRSPRYKNNELVARGLSEPSTGSQVIVALSHDGKATKCAVQ